MRILNRSACALLVIVSAACLQVIPDRAAAHFSYSDPRVVHIIETEAGEVAILMRMPAPLALLPGDWQGAADNRLPPFGARVGDQIVLDPRTLRTEEAALHQLLSEGLTIWIDGSNQSATIGRTKLWHDADRPTFGTAKSASKTLDREAPSTLLPYFDTTLDVEFLIADGSLTSPLRITSDLGRNFQVMEQFGTVVKLHRDSGTETRAMIGVLDAEFDGVVTPLQRLVSIAWIGAEHIYLGFDHLAMILLIAIAAISWRQALLWASAFTVGHVVTLAAGLYGYAPQAAWFIPAIELLIVSSIVAAGIAIVLRLPHVMNWPALFVVGLIHGYGFAAAASVALFAGDIDAPALLAFAVGLELCKLVVYLVLLPIIILLDRLVKSNGLRWRMPVALVLAGAASVSVLQQLMQVTGFSVA
ncbi:HupE/UreJ family protein [uncultured Roseobacter sp.]|uniref:HupE/UreJ family protein n=1 Tax=uncultured Roseobacter sp. TaxID=114847 RepID=UPI00262CEA73|nr:HupE/UreJ family protein [uncultured Roseobacter sp.]